MSTGQAASSLLQLPDHCLVAVLCCCAGNHCSVCSAARAHSRLHQAAIVALSSITEYVNQRQLDRLMEVYLAKHGSHVDSIDLEAAWPEQGFTITLHQLPNSLTKLSSLYVDRVHLQLHPAWGYQGVLSAAAALPLKQLGLVDCKFLDEEGLAALLALLPGLEQLTIVGSGNTARGITHIPLGVVLPGLKQLTYLELADVWLGAHDEGDEDSFSTPHKGDLQHLTALTRLVDLRLSVVEHSITASMLSGAQHLTRLELCSGTSYDEVLFDPAALAGKTLLQHLDLKFAALITGVLLSQLQLQQQLTCLVLRCCGVEVYPPAASYAALTASSKLAHLDISGAIMPAGVWQHVFPGGRQLPHLQVLDISDVRHPGYEPAAAPEGTRLVSCCPGLQSLDIMQLLHGRGLLAALQGLSSLHTLYLRPGLGSTEGVDVVCQLTGLRQLWLPHGAAEGLLLPLRQLRQLTQLCTDDERGRNNYRIIRSETAGEPVWRQVLQLYLDHSDPEVAQQAAASLAESS